MAEFITNIEGLASQRQEAIKRGLQSQIIAQAVFVREEQPTKFLSYIDEEIDKADSSMLKMVEASSQEGAELYSISEIYIWNKERKKALERLKKEYLELTQQPQSLNPEPQQIPKELTTPEAKAYFKKAIELGLMDSNNHWLKGQQMLTCFAREMSIRLKIGKGDRIAWKPFEILFNVSSGKLRLNYNDIQKTGQAPKDVKLIDKVFE